MSYLRPPAGTANAGWLTASEYTRTTDASFEADQGAIGILSADLPPVAPGFSLAAEGGEWEPDYYIVPDLAVRVELPIGYLPPPQSDPGVLCSDNTYQPPGGILQADLPPPELAFDLQAGAAPVYNTQAGAHLPADYTLIFEGVAAGEQVHPCTAAATLPQVHQPTINVETQATQILDLPDNDSASIRPRHRASYPSAELGLLFRQRHGQDITIPAAIAQKAATQVQNRLVAKQAEMIRFQRPLGQSHQHGESISGDLSVPHAEAVRTRESARERHQHGIKRQGNSGLPHAETIKRRQSVRLAEQQGLKFAKGLGIGNHNAWPTGTRLEVRWTKADHPAPGYWWPERYLPPGLRIVMPCEDYYEPRPLDRKSTRLN